MKKKILSILVVAILVVASITPIMGEETSNPGDNLANDTFGMGVEVTFDEGTYVIGKIKEFSITNYVGTGVGKTVNRSISLTGPKVQNFQYYSNQKMQWVSTKEFDQTYAMNTNESNLKFRASFGSEGYYTLQEVLKNTTGETLAYATRYYKVASGKIIRVWETPSEVPTEEATTKAPTTTKAPIITKVPATTKKVIAPAKAKAPKAKEGKKKVSLTLKKVKGAKGYMVQYATNKKFKKSTIKMTTKIKLTLKKLKSKKTYYIRVKAYKLDGKKKVYAKKWSIVKKVKIK